MRDNSFSDLNSQIGAHCPIPIILTNGYYGYQPVHNQTYDKTENCENQMEIENNLSENANLADRNTQLTSRKRPNSEVLGQQAFKKRRQNGMFHPAETSKPKFGRKPTHNLPDIPRKNLTTFIQNKENESVRGNVTEELLQGIHGSSLHHWKRESDL